MNIILYLHKNNINENLCTERIIKGEIVINIKIYFGEKRKTDSDFPSFVTRRAAALICKNFRVKIPLSNGFVLRKICDANIQNVFIYSPVEEKHHNSMLTMTTHFITFLPQYRLLRPVTFDFASVLFGRNCLQAYSVCAIYINTHTYMYLSRFP